MKRSAILAALAALVLPAATQADDSAITLHVLKPKVVFGDRVPLRGRVTPAAAGVRVVAERQGEILAHGRTDSRGLYTIWIRAGKSGTWRTRIAGTGVHSGPVGLTVSPQLTITAGKATAFVGAPVVVTAKPKTGARATLTVFRLGKPVAERQRSGREEGDRPDRRDRALRAARRPRRRRTRGRASSPARARCRTARPARTCRAAQRLLGSSTSTSPALRRPSARSSTTA